MVSESTKDSKEKLSKSTENLTIKDPIKNWSHILNAINEKDERIYGLIKKTKLKLDDDNLVIDLGNEGNDFIKTTLIKKTELIEQAIYDVTNKRNKIKIINNINKNDIENKQEHPLLNNIKNKFDGELDRRYYFF